MMVLLLLAALLPVRELERVALDAVCRAEGPRVVCVFAAPGDLREKHVRLETGCAGGVQMNGIWVARDEAGLDLTPYLSSRGENRVSFGRGCLPAALLVTPRVFVSSLRAEPGSGRPLAMVENTLENTVNVSVACRPQMGDAEWRRASGTVAAGSRQELGLSGPVFAGGGRLLVECELEKSAEAVEESYTYRAVLDFQALTKNGRANIR